MEKISFVGAGPGAVDLITVRGKELIEQADVIVYAGSLVNPKLLQYAASSCTIYNSALMTLEEVMKIMISSATKGQRVVRLHTGDPSIYGAIREQMDILDENKIEYEVCPGVSACFGAAASLKLEYTLPDISQTLIITRCEGRTKMPQSEKIRELASHGCSMAIYLSSDLLGKLQEELLCGGCTNDTPAAIVYKATWPEEKILPCKVGNLEKIGKENNITNTALVIVGEVIDHQNYSRSQLYSPDFETGFRSVRN